MNPSNAAWNISDHRLEELLAIARDTAWGAANILMEFQNSGFAIDNAGDGPITTADTTTNQYILDQLQARTGDEAFAYLTEETYKSQPPAERLGKPWVWIIDPLDGTKDFITRTGEFAIHIALAKEGRPVLAVVAWPAKQKVYYAQLGKGTHVETRYSDGTSSHQAVSPSRRDRPEDLTLIVSRTHRDQRFDQLLQRLSYQNQHAVGSVGCKIATILEQQADVYISLSGKSAPKDWDIAAPELILTEAGGQFTHFDGSPILYNQVDVSQWGGLLASNGRCHALLCAQAEQALQAVDS